MPTSPRPLTAIGTDTLMQALRAQRETIGLQRHRCLTYCIMIWRYAHIGATGMPDLFYCDDARQERPSRPEMGPLVAIGYLHVPDERVHVLERALQRLCDEFGFPPGAEGEFKWSPSRRHWMRDNLVGDDRRMFFTKAMKLANGYGVTAGVVIADTVRLEVEQMDDHLGWITQRLVTHLELSLRAVDRVGLVVTDRPSGGRSDEDSFLEMAVQALRRGISFYHADRIAINVLSTPSRFVRSLQLADVVTSCTTAYVAGESEYSEAIFESVEKLLTSRHTTKNGIAVDLYPEKKYVNLYYWLFRCTHADLGGSSRPLPFSGFLYEASPMAP
jgi:hypothetical protein